MMPRRSLALLLLGGTLCAVAAGADNRIVVRVNDQIATLYDYRQRLAERLDQIRQAGLPAAQRQELEGEAGRAVMREIYEELLLADRAEQLGIQFTPADVDRAMESTSERLGLPDRAALEQALQQAGRSVESYREQLRRTLAINAVMSREVRPRVQPDEREVREYYRDHEEELRTPTRLRLEEVVLLDESGLTVAERLARGQEICARVEEGAELAAAAGPLVESGIATGVVDLGQVERPDLEPALAEAVWEQPAGACVPVVGRGGVHVVHVVERQEAGVPPFEEVRSRIESELINQRFQSELDAYLEELVARSYVKADPPPEAIGFRRAATAEELPPEAAPSAGEEPVPPGEEEQPAEPLDEPLDEPLAPAEVEDPAAEALEESPPAPASPRAPASEDPDPPSTNTAPTSPAGP